MKRTRIKSKLLKFALCSSLFFSGSPMMLLAQERVTQEITPSNENLQGLITQNNGVATVADQGTVGSDATWALADFKHPDGNGNEQAVWKGTGQKGEKTTYSSYQVKFDFSSPTIFLVYDYIWSGDPDSGSNLAHKIAPSIQVSNAQTNDTNKPENDGAVFTDEQELNKASWKTIVVQLSQENPVWRLRHTMHKRDQSSFQSAYVSNLRIYEKAEDLPEDLKVTVNYQFDPELTNNYQKNNKSSWRLSFGCYNNLDKPEQLVMPINSTFVSYLSSKTDDRGRDLAQINGWQVLDDSGSQINSSDDYRIEQNFTKPGVYTVKALAEPLADIADKILVSTKKDSEAGWDSQITDISDLNEAQTFTQTIGIDTNRIWRIEILKGKYSYDTVSVTDNEETAYLHEDGDDKYYYELLPGNETHYITLTFSQKDRTEATRQIMIFPTLSVDEVFGEEDENGIKKIEGLTNDWAENVDPRGNLTYLYDPNSPDRDETHSKVFTTSEYGPHFKALTLTPEHAGIVSFDYKFTLTGDYNEFCLYKASNYTSFLKLKESCEWTHVDIPVNSSEDYIRIELYDSQAGNASISNIQFLSEPTQLTFNINGDGSVTGMETGTNDFYVGARITLQAQPDEGSVFIGWYDQNDRLLSNDFVYTHQVSKEVTNLTAKFLENTGVALKGDKIYDSLSQALNEAQAGEMVILLKDTQLDQSATVKNGVTLLIPSSQEDRGYNAETGFNPDGTVKTPATGALGDKYRELTIPSNITLTIDGTVLVNAVTGRPAAGHYDMDVTGGYGQVVLDGSISVNDGGLLDVFGYIKGSGNITVQSGGELRDLYVVRNWRGGSQAFAMFPTVYPMNQADMHNVQADTVIQSGGTLAGNVKMYASGSYYYTVFPQVDNANGLIRLTDGSVTKTYSNGREKLILDGGGQIASSTLKIVGLPLSTGGFIYPIDGDTDIEFNSGDWSIVERFKVMPGGKVSVKENATVKVEKTTVMEQRENELAFYDTGFTDPYNTDHTEYPTQQRGNSELIVEGGTTTQLNGSFGGNIKVAESVSKDNPARVVFDQISVTTTEANGYYSNNTGNAKVNYTFHASIDGESVEPNSVYYCWKEDGQTILSKGKYLAASAPQLTHTDASSASSADGSIQIQTEPGKSYEYQGPDTSGYLSVAEDGEISGLTPGTYFVRVKETADYFASDPVEVVIGVKPAPVQPSTPAQPSAPSKPQQPAAPSTTTNPDGSTTTTTTDSAGNKTTTTEKTDGSTEVVEEKIDGSTITTTTNADGSSEKVEENADGSTTTTVVNTDGSSEKVEEHVDGSKTTTTDDGAGTTQIKEEKVDGSVETTTNKADGSVEKVEESADKLTTTTTNTDAAGTTSQITENKSDQGNSPTIQGSISVSEETVKQAASTGSNVTITMPEIPADRTDDNVQIEVVIPESAESATLEIPVDASTIEPGSVAMIEDEQGNLIPIVESIGKDGKLIVPLSKNCKIVIKDNKKSFADVTGSTKDYPANGIAFLSARNLMTGVGDGTNFDLTGKVTRAQLATILYRQKGEPDTSFMALPQGVKDGDYFSNAARWAANSGLMGVGSNFNAADLLTREQLAMILWRVEGRPNDYSLDFSKYSDSSSISTPEMQKAVGWAVKSGLMGKGTSKLNASGSSQRQELAAMLSRYLMK